MEQGIEQMHVALNVLRVLLAFGAVSLIAMAMTGEFHAAVDERLWSGPYVMSYLSVALLHWLAWSFMVGDSRIVGSDAKAFIHLGKKPSFYSYIEAFGYIVLATEMFRPYVISGLERSDRELRFGLVFTFMFSMTLIGIGVANRVRLLLRDSAQDRPL